MFLTSNSSCQYNPHLVQFTVPVPRLWGMTPHDDLMRKLKYKPPYWTGIWTYWDVMLMQGLEAPPSTLMRLVVFISLSFGRLFKAWERKSTKLNIFEYEKLQSQFLKCAFALMRFWRNGFVSLFLVWPDFRSCAAETSNPVWHVTHQLGKGVYGIN